MASFKDTRNITFSLDIKQKDTVMVRNLLKDAEGKPLDLLAMADTGNLHQLFGRAQLMLDTVFLICLDQVKELFSEEDFDRSHDVELETIPGLRTSKLQKMAFWFGEGVGPEQIPEITNAFKEAIVNFTPNPYQREALRRVIANQEALEKAQMERAVLLADDRLKKVNMAMEKQLQRELDRSPDLLLENIPNLGQNDTSGV
ncbi:MAG: hypothetical protein IJD43_09580 [Thermoguttaceae bacterium]|nr:hypothetical protein [Thermoguttaceae bacterium]